MDYHIIPVVSGTIRKTKVYSAQLAQITPKFIIASVTRG